MRAGRVPVVVGGDPLAVAEATEALARARGLPAGVGPWGAPTPAGVLRGVWGAPLGPLTEPGPLFLARAPEAGPDEALELAWWRAIRQARPGSAALWAAAEPESGWGTLDGYRLHGGRVPAADGAEPYLQRVARARRARPARLTYGTVRLGAAAIAESLGAALRRADAPDLVWADALDEADLRAIAEGLAGAPWPLVPVGGPAFAGGLGALEAPAAAPPEAPIGRLLRPEGPVLTLIGSAREALLAQLPIVASEARVVRYPVEEALLGREEALSGFERAVGSVLAARQDVVVALHLPGTPDLAAVAAGAAAAGLGPGQLAALIGARLAGSARYWGAGGALRALVAIGRETCAHLMAALPGALGLEKPASAALGHPVWRDEAGMRLVLAPGRLPGPETLAAWHEALKRLPDAP